VDVKQKQYTAHPTSISVGRQAQPSQVVASSRHQDNSKRNPEYVPDSASGLYERGAGSFFFFGFLEGREASEHRSVAAALVRHSG
jgi:hypothetical protein